MGIAMPFNRLLLKSQDVQEPVDAVASSLCPSLPFQSVKRNQFDIGHLSRSNHMELPSYD